MSTPLVENASGPVLFKLYNPLRASTFPPDAVVESLVLLLAEFQRLGLWKLLLI